MPGYSGTPLPRKLGIKNGFRAFLFDPPNEVLAELRDVLKKCELLRERNSAIDFSMLFVTSRIVLESEFRLTGKLLAPAGMLWVSWPKKASGVKTDLNENVVRDIGLQSGLVDVKVCAVTEIWSGLKFVKRLKDR